MASSSASVNESASVNDRDYTLIIDKSGSMGTPERVGGQTKTRWALAQESTLALARRCEQLDQDGITVYLFSDTFRRYDNVTADKVAEIFRLNSPGGTTDLAAVLADCFDKHFKRRGGKQSSGLGSLFGRKATPAAQADRDETILVITDGAPDDQYAVKQQIISASNKILQDKQLALSLIQVGSDFGATRFLKSLDDELQGCGARFDIVDTVTLDDMENMTLAEVLLNAIND